MKFGFRTSAEDGLGVSGSHGKVYLVMQNQFKKDALQGFELKEHMGEKGAVTWLFGRDGEPHILLAGLGEQAKLHVEHIRVAAGNAGRAAEKQKLDSVSFYFDAFTADGIAGDPSAAEIITAVVEGWLLGTYAFDKYKSNKAALSVTKLNFMVEASPELEQAIRYAKIRAEGTMLARDLGNEPPNYLRPSTLVERVTEHFQQDGVQIKVYRGEQLEQLRMNGLIAVGKGSNHPPALIEMRYCTDPSKPCIALVGKGITFDTGGISLKSGRDLSDMRIDMGGAAAVIGAMHIIVNSKLPVNIVALVATAENMPDAGSMLPGELIHYANDVTVQVKNTDAEGRLVLADALIHAHHIGAKQIIDIATLTGACVAALGVRMAGTWGTEGMPETLQKLGNLNGEKAWPMPLEEEYRELLKSSYADMANITNVPYAGAITAALFLQKFIDPLAQWAHLDIAGPMESGKTSGYTVEGATGYGARLLADYVADQG